MSVRRICVKASLLLALGAHIELLVEAIHLPFGVYNTLFAGEKWMAV